MAIIKSRLSPSRRFERSSLESNNWSSSCRSVLLHNPPEKADVPNLGQLQYQYIASCKAFSSYSNGFCGSVFSLT
uniref:Uncharacterized protein n=1 Tax=Utricularia reniformis TaxID=192314 RepID=A0A1Y0B2B1_9LAMI|nr:hypothetical protein AEK19_MT1332 [Utricularia reniformis]ART31530.1 hypothetical protein AEK19_MT1332 [Utricularia reniformis]